MHTSNIVDPSGKPIQVKVLKSQQINQPQMAGLHRRFSEHPSSGLTPAKLASIMKNAEQGDLVAQAELAEDIEEKDAHVFAELQKRKLALLNVDWQIEPPINPTDAELKATDFLIERLAYLDLEDIIFDMADAILKSYSCATIKWGLVDGYQTPVEIEHVPSSWFTTAEHKRNQLQLLNDDGGSVEMWAGGWIKHIHKTKSGYVARGGLTRVLSWPFLFKNYSLRDLAEFLEIYGLPLRLGKYPAGATTEEKSKLLQAVVEIGHNAAGIIPDSMLIEFQNAAQGQAEPFEAMIAWAEKAVSKAILGGTLTSQADGKSSTNALGNVHNEVRHDIRDADLRQIANTLTRDLIYPMVQFNLQGINGFHRCPKFKFNTAKTEDVSMLAEALPKLQQAGLAISKQWLHDKTQIPAPVDEDDTLIASMPTTPGTEVVPLTAQSCSCNGCVALSKQSSALVGSLEDSLNPVQTDFIEQIKQLVMNAEGFEQLQQQLAKLAGDDVEKQADLLAQAMTLAELAGRSEILDEALNA